MSEIRSAHQISVKRRHLLQCNVVSDGKAVPDDVVRVLDAPCLSSSLIWEAQYGRNFAIVFAGFTRAKHPTSCPNARTAFDFALVVA